MSVVPEGEGNPFAKAGPASDDILTHIVSYLDGTARHPLIRQIRRVGMDLMRVRPGQRLLDAGCGLGEAAQELADHVAPGGHVVGVDSSAAFIALAEQRAEGTLVTYRVGDVTSLGFPDGSFDGARCERVLQHIDRPDNAVAELTRVTRPGGRVCLIDTDWNSFLVEGVGHQLVAEIRNFMHALGANQHHDMGRSLRGRLVRAGMSDVECQPVTMAFTDAADAGSIIPFFNREANPVTNMLEPGLRAAWYEAIDAALVRDELLAALTIWIVAGSRPS